MNKIKLFDSIALLEDLSEENLRRGQVGAVVGIYKGGEAFEVEFVNSDGKIYGLLTLRPEQIMLLRRGLIKKIAV